MHHHAVVTVNQRSYSLSLTPCLQRQSRPHVLSLSAWCDNVQNGWVVSGARKYTTYQDMSSRLLSCHCSGFESHTAMSNAYFVGDLPPLLLSWTFQSETRGRCIPTYLSTHCTQVYSPLTTLLCEIGRTRPDMHCPCRQPRSHVCLPVQSGLWRSLNLSVIEACPSCYKAPHAACCEANSVVIPISDSHFLHYSD